MVLKNLMGGFQTEGRAQRKRRERWLSTSPEKTRGRKPELRGLVPFLQENGHLSVALGCEGEGCCYVEIDGKHIIQLRMIRSLHTKEGERLKRPEDLNSSFKCCYHAIYEECADHISSALASFFGRSVLVVWTRHALWSAVTPSSECCPLTAVSCHFPPRAQSSQRALPRGSGDAAHKSCHRTEIKGFDIQFLYHFFYSNILLNILFQQSNKNHTGPMIFPIVPVICSIISLNLMDRYLFSFFFTILVFSVSITSYTYCY